MKLTNKYFHKKIKFLYFYKIILFKYIKRYFFTLNLFIINNIINLRYLFKIQINKRNIIIKFYYFYFI
jgi:hypothetical protein